MTTSEERLVLTGKKRLWFRLLYYPLMALLIFSVAEIAVRIKGFRPWTTTRPDIVVEPGGKFYQAHPLLGYTLLPGHYKVTLAGSYSYEVTNLDSTLRITHPLSTYPGGVKKGIWIFGDSVTYGQSVNDEETFCWLLQERFPDYEIVNFGVMGYGELHSLIQLRESLNHGDKPKLVILTYASWQDVRSTFIRLRRKIVAPTASLGPVNQPYARLNSDGRLDILTDALVYRPFPLMGYSAFINFLEESYDKYEERQSRSHEVTKAIIKEISALCRAQGIELVVAGLTSDPTTADMFEYLKGDGIKLVNISVDFLNIKENNNLPYDSHPSAVAHRQYADKLDAFLRNSVLNGSRGN